MKLLDLFSGIGGFSHGLVQAGMELVGYCELDKHAHQAFQILHDPEERLWNAYDVRTIDPVRLPEFDCICFGWPCQDNSIAGKRNGQIKRDESNEGNRSGLLFEATRIIRARQPKYFVAENVEGLLSVNDGRDFYATIREFTDMGYDIQWGVLNSSAYVPQNRKRIFFVGHLRGQRRPEVFPFGSENENTIKVVGKLEGSHDQNSRVYGIGGVAPTLSTMQGGGQEPKILDDQGRTTKKHAYDMVAIPVLTPDREEKRQNGRRFKEPGEPMFTLTAQDKHGVAIKEITCVNPRKEDGTQTYQHDRVYDTDGIMPALISDLAGRFNILESKNGTEIKHGTILDAKNGFGQVKTYNDTCPTLLANDYKEMKKVVDGYRIRKLTPLECMRLQSFPDWWYYKLKEHGISDSQLYKMAGNAVTSAVAYEIGKRMMALILRETPSS